MMRRTLFLGSLTLLLIGFTGQTALAWFNWSGDLNWGTFSPYKASFGLRGGQKPGTQDTFIGAQLEIVDGALVCVNPGRERSDVRSGMGGLTLFALDSDFAETMDDRGNFTAAVSMYRGVHDAAYALGCMVPGEEPLTYAQLADYCKEAFWLFAETYGFWGYDDTNVSSACRNDNWLPAEFLIKVVRINGKLYEDCQVDGDGVLLYPDEEDYGCSYRPPDIFGECETDETYRYWGDDGTPIWECVVE